MQVPAKVLASLDHDYLYAALVPTLYAHPLATPAQPVRTREFSEFFDELTLHFHEQVVVAPTAQQHWLTLVCRGTLDTQLTDVAAIAALMAKATGPAADPVTGQPLVPHFYYEATHALDRATGLPRHVELRVYGRLAQHYNKQYTLTITHLS